MKIIIAGAYAIGTHLARLLSRSKEEITLIDESEERLASILKGKSVPRCAPDAYPEW